MGINIGEITHPTAGQIRLEISNDDEFVKRVKAINKDLPGTNKSNMTRWKIRRVGEDRVPAKIQQLIDKGGEENGVVETVEAVPVERELLPSPLDEAEVDDPPPVDPAKPKRRMARRARPGGAIK